MNAFVRPTGGVVAAVAAAGVATACADAGAGAGDAAVRTDSAGVEIVVSPAADRPLPWTFEEELRLGGANDGPASFTRVRLFTFGADGAGNLYFLDTDAGRVVVFGPDGEHLRTLGSKGGGPGEFQFPIGFSVAPEGTAVVFDVGKGGLVPFAPDGSPLAEVPFPHFTEPGVRHFVASDDRIVVSRSVRFDDGRGLELVTWGDASGADTTRLAYMEFPETVMADFGCMSMALQPLFTPVIRWSAAGDFVAVASEMDYRVDVFSSDGTPVRSLRRPLPLAEATAADAVAEAEPGMQMRGERSCDATAREVADARGYRESIPAIRNVQVATDGAVWVERWVPGTLSEGGSGPLDVFAPDGAYVGTAPAGIKFPLALLPDDRIAFAVKDELDIERLVVLRIDRGGDAAP